MCQVSLELVKTLTEHPLEHFKNAFLNLALNVYAFSEPGEVKKEKLTDKLTTTIWDRWEVDEGDIT